MTSEVQTKAGRSDATARPKIHLDPVGFWSYARDNEDLSEGRLADILRQIKAELASRFGRLEIFQDTSSMRHGDAWETRIRESITRSTFFIPILTPHFLRSKWCMQEVEWFLEREQQLFDAYPDLPRTSRIFPILYVDIEGATSIRPDLVAKLNARNWFDMSEMRYAERVDVGEVGRAIGDYAKSIRTLLMIEVETPLSAEEREALLREAEAAAKAEREEQDARKRALEEAERIRALAEEEAREQARIAAKAAALAAEVQQHDDHVAALAALSARLDAGLAHSCAQAELREKLAAADAEAKHQRDLARSARGERNKRRLRRILVATGWVIGVAVTLLALPVVYFSVFPPAPRDGGNEQTSVTGNLAGNMTVDIRSAPPSPAKPRFAAEEWITEQPWAVGAKCGSSVSFSIEGNDLIVDQGDAPERHAIDAAQSTDDRLVADGLTLSRTPARSAADSRMTMIYPDFKVEVLPCATRR
ncbi:MAG: toll/interleukin-1 receptor domain-containing protein [Sphingomonas sp.]|nr:toll/interleukin-1 receptor domain-containing protein [Sphingomonas sp.]